MTDGLVAAGPDGPVPVAAVAGEIDLANATQLLDEALRLVTDAAPGLVVDLTAVTYMDSAGMRVLFDLARELKRRDQALAVAVPIGSPLRRVLKITHFDEAAAVCESVEAAAQLLCGSDDPEAH